MSGQDRPTYIVLQDCKIPSVQYERNKLSHHHTIHTINHTLPTTILTTNHTHQRQATTHLRPGELGSLEYRRRVGSSFRAKRVLHEAGPAVGVMALEAVGGY